MSAEQLITQHLDIWTSAHKTRSSAGRGSGNKLDLYGIKKLRELILELAVRGKLVPQDPNDEPASELLKKIAAEKALLIKEGKIKKEKPLPEIRDEEKYFLLPNGWEWIRLGQGGICSTGGTPSSSNSHMFSGEIPFIGPGQITPDGRLLPAEKYLTEEGCLDSSVATVGDILMVCIGGSIGKSLVVETRLTFNQQINCISPIKLSSYYLDCAMNSLGFQRELLSNSTGSATPIINRSKWEELLVAIPPLAEQQRIVVKVDELMSFCDQLEQAQTDNILAHAQLVETLLTTLTNSKDHQELQANWQRIAEHFDTLFTTEDSIDQLKKTILQLAVMGKLVPQDPNDEPASELLKKIAAEKAQLIKEGKIKKEKPLPEITEEEKPFELPKGWQWVRLKEVTSKITDGDHQTPPRIDYGFRLLSAKNVRDGFLDVENCDYISEEHYLKSRERCLPEAGDLLIVSVGGTIGRSSVVPPDSEFALVRSVALIKPLAIDSNFLKYSMDSSLLQNSIHSRKRGGAQPCLYLSEISNFPFVLPPLAEQRLIVAKVDELMTLCDELKLRILSIKSTQLELADGLVEQAVS